MITISHYKNGTHIEGHDVIHICELVSYSMWACACDCQQEDESNTDFYGSGGVQGHKQDGVSWFIFNHESNDCQKIYNRYRYNIAKKLADEYPNRVQIINKLTDMIDLTDLPKTKWD